MTTSGCYEKEQVTGTIVYSSPTGSDDPQAGPRTQPGLLQTSAARENRYLSKETSARQCRHVVKSAAGGNSWNPGNRCQVRQQVRRIPHSIVGNN